MGDEIKDSWVEEPFPVPEVSKLVQRISDLEKLNSELLRKHKGFLWTVNALRKYSEKIKDDRDYWKIKYFANDVMLSAATASASRSKSALHDYGRMLSAAFITYKRQVITHSNFDDWTDYLDMLAEND